MNKINDEILMQVEKPARYTGNEINMVRKNPKDVSTRIAFCFPDVYEVGMSHLGLQILYFFFNRREDTYCERAFAPWVDMENLMREKNIPLTSLETGTPLKEFDFVAFTLQYEMCYTNMLNMLDLSGIPLLREERGEDDPLILCGGSCTYNPEPLADFVDIFYMGEGEVIYDEILDMYREHRKSGGTKAEYLEKLLEFDGLYMPKFYDVEYKENGEIKSFKKNNEKARSVIKKVIVNDMDKSFFPEKQLVPLIETVHDRVTLEVFRGCIRGCRFCQAGFVYRPVREKSAETLLCQAKGIFKNTGHDEISLVSLSTSDYTEFPTLADSLIEEFTPKKVNIALPSLRIDSFSLDLMSKIQEVRKSSLTFAPEAGTQRLRDVINKNITEENILNGCKLAFSGGFERVKLYFMIGLPTERTEDLVGIADLSAKIVDSFYETPKEERKGRGVTVVTSSSCFVPKPFTPFQWDRQDTMEEFTQKIITIKKSLKRKQIKYNYHDPDLSFLECVTARGDRRIGRAILEAWRLGCKFDAWNDLFKYDLWIKAFENTGIDPHFYANRKRSYDEILPWDHISVGVTKEFFIREREKAERGETTKNCREECQACGAASFGGGVCFEKVQN